jgi:tight adherence protein B
LEALRQIQLPEALERIAGALRSGSSTPQAIAEAGRSVVEPLGPELSVLALSMRRGRSLVDVVDEWAAGRRDSGTRLVATALVLASGLGAAPARALDGVAATLRERLELADERHALATQARMSATVLSAAPFGLALLLAASDPAIAHFLLATSAGWMCLVVGGALEVAGALWMARLTRSAER